MTSSTNEPHSKPAACQALPRGQNERPGIRRAFPIPYSLSYCPTGGTGADLGVDKYPATWFFELIVFTTISYSAGSFPA